MTLFRYYLKSCCHRICFGLLVLVVLIAKTFLLSEDWSAESVITYLGCIALPAIIIFLLRKPIVKFQQTLSRFFYKVRWINYAVFPLLSLLLAAVFWQQYIKAVDVKLWIVWAMCTGLTLFQCFAVLKESKNQIIAGILIFLLLYENIVWLPLFISGLVSYYILPSWFPVTIEKLLKMHENGQLDEDYEDDVLAAHYCVTRGIQDMPPFLHYVERTQSRWGWRYVLLLSSQLEGIPVHQARAREAEKILHMNAFDIEWPPLEFQKPDHFTKSTHNP